MFYVMSCFKISLALHTAQHRFWLSEWASNQFNTKRNFGDESLQETDTAQVMTELTHNNQQKIHKSNPTTNWPELKAKA